MLSLSSGITIDFYLFFFFFICPYHFSTMNMNCLKMKNYKTPTILKVKFKKIDKILKLNL